VVIAEIVLDVEPDDGPAEDDTGLALVVWYKASVLNELWHVDIGNVETADFGNKL